MLIAKPCHNSEEIADFINAYGEFLEGWGIVEGTNPPVIVLYVKEGKEEEVKELLDEFGSIETLKTQKTCDECPQEPFNFSEAVDEYSKTIRVINLFLRLAEKSKKNEEEKKNKEEV
ncbi:hypothetical protein SAMN06269117_1453 [Balnearium lithotrophicum]|uniref:Uncharacterized protein n=1 Tax=Balnearium lithotrophicum TaxID=223788 RepID=A0A521ELB2_9BACT|nr:hypothetical protein [Balnearium lithotrophicum]SMO84709.1 hypothetical protein SAMN06269117_1453 [Balnearium lithotrophicum]